MANKTTTIKISRAIKARIDNLRVYPKESYEEILSRMLETLNICRNNPVRARGRLVMIDRQRKMNGLVNSHVPEKKLSISIPVDSEDEE